MRRAMSANVLIKTVGLLWMSSGNAARARMLSLFLRNTVGGYVKKMPLKYCLPSVKMFSDVL